MSKLATKQIKILPICDFPIYALGLERVVQLGGANLTLSGLARNVTEALHLLAKAPADVILLDLDGDNDVGAIPQLLVAGNARVLVLTTSCDIERQDAAVLAGASGVVGKRELPDVLLKAIEKVHDGEFWIDRAATVRILTSVARKNATTNPEQDKILLLTRKERLVVTEVVRDTAIGSREIALRLFISEHTLRNHLSSIYAKLGLASRMELYIFAQKYSLNGGPT